MNRNILNFIGMMGLFLALACGLFIEFSFQYLPCSLCFLQRACMLMVAFGLYLNLIYGAEVRHYAFSLLSSLLGLCCSLRHMGLNVCKPISEDTFFFCSYRMYTWSFLVFFLSLFCLSLLLFFYKKTKPVPLRMQKIARGLLGIILMLCLGSILYHKGLTL